MEDLCWASIAVVKSKHDFSVEMLKLDSLLLEYVLEMNYLCVDKRSKFKC